MKFGNAAITASHVCSLCAHENETKMTGCSNFSVQESRKHMKFGNSATYIRLTIANFKFVAMKKESFYRLTSRYDSHWEV